ncbi:MAG: hypothetical protein RBR22_08180 [Desulfuromonas sp.]|nr:hypothetical protein [Desulfuromonas sp.]
MQKQELSKEEYDEIFEEIENQPRWRAIADKESDYADGNQLDSELLKRQQELGIPPAVEDLIGPALLSIQGYEATIRTDWRVTPNGDPGGQDVADAINFKLNQAERESKADRACSAAFQSQITCGIGWVEVARDSDPFKFPYRCKKIHRNEIHWDMKATEPDLSDARWLRRQRWLSPERIALVFPEKKELILAAGRHGSQWWQDETLTFEGGDGTGLENAWNEGRSWTMHEDRWYNPRSKELCVAELWYRRWVRVPVIKTPNGRVVEFDEANLQHAIAVASGTAEVTQATIARVRRAYWLGPHKLHDGPTPYAHRHFPYVPFWGFIEDATGIPYGYVRSMKYAQDSLNSGLSKLRWGMSVVRVERTKGAVAMTDSQLRKQIARPDADIVLDNMHMQQAGARFDVKRDYQLTDQHYQMLNDNRATFERVSGITAGFGGKQGTATSGLQEQTQVEQSNQALGRIMDNFREARSQVGELLMSMIIRDIGEKQTEVVIEGDAITADRQVTLNAPETDPETGVTYLSNDINRTRLMVSLEDVPSTNSYRAQQLQALTEAIKPLPAEYLSAAIPFLTQLMDVPFKRDLIEAFRSVGQTPTPEQIEEQTQQAIQDALAKAGNELKERELQIKERKADSEMKNLDAKAVQIGVQAAFAAMQAGAQIAQMPMIAPIADTIMQGAGYQRPNPMGDDPDFPAPQQVAATDIRNPYVQGEGAQLGSEQVAELAQVNQNTSPQFPPVPSDGDSSMQGIETPNTNDNMPGGM